MAPQNGQLAWLILGELVQRISVKKLEFQPCYLSCYSDSQSAQTAGNHPYFKDDIAAGRYDVAHWSELGGALQLHHQQRMLTCSDNPVVILGIGYFQTLGSQLVGIYNGKTLQASAAITKVNATRDAFEFDYQWQADPEPLPTLAEPLLAYYRHHCNGSTFTLPLQAIEQLDALDKFARGRSLLLAADAGVNRVQQLRMGALCPPASWCTRDPAPAVNFHALSLHQQRQGAQAWQQQLDDSGTVLYMAWHDDSHPISSINFKQITDTLAAAHPDDIRQLVLSQHAIEDTLTLLRLSHYDPQLLKANITRLLEASASFTPSARRRWQDALVRTWCHYLPTTEYDDFYYQVGLMAAQVGHFGLAKECFQWGLYWYGDEPTDLYLLAWCEAATGGVTYAQQLLARALTQQPEHPPSRELNLSLQQRVEAWHNRSGYLPQPVGVSASPLRLEPLGDEHAASFLYQFRDHQIGIMTRLPRLETLEQVQNWIHEQQQENDRACFAVMHESWGFVGVVCMHSAGAAGYFYFWVGSDFQGQGIGQQASQLLFDVMAQQGVTEIFTSAYQDNARSIHALTRLGFEKLAIRAEEPDETLDFFYRTQNDTPCDQLIARTALIDLCQAIKSPLQLL